MVFKVFFLNKLLKGNKLKLKNKHIVLHEREHLYHTIEYLNNCFCKKN